MIVFAGTRGGLILSNITTAAIILEFELGAAWVNAGTTPAYIVDGREVSGTGYFAWRNDGVLTSSGVTCTANGSSVTTSTAISALQANAVIRLAIATGHGGTIAVFKKGGGGNEQPISIKTLKVFAADGTTLLNNFAVDSINTTTNIIPDLVGAGVAEAEINDPNGYQVVLGQVDPVLDTPQADVTIQEGQTGTIQAGANFSDPNSDTLTFSISPNINPVQGFTFNTSTGAIVYDGSQVAAGAISYTVTADDGEFQTSDTFTITVIAPVFTIDSVSDSTPDAGSTVTINVSNEAAAVTASCSAGSLSGTYSSGQFVLNVPNPPDFGDKTLTYAQDIVVTLSDGTDTGTVTIQIQIPSTELFDQIAEVDGIYLNDTGVAVGMYSRAFNIVGTPVIDLTTGLYTMLDNESFEYQIYDGVWGTGALVEVPEYVYSPASSQTYLPPTGYSVVTLLGIDENSWLNDPDYIANAGGDANNISVGDQIVYKNTTNEGGYTVVIDEYGLVDIIGAGTETVNQTMNWFYLDAQDGYQAGAEAVLTIYSPDQIPKSLISIDSITPNKTSIVVVFSYPGTDATSFQYNIGASWITATSPLTISGLIADTSYNLQLRPVNNGSFGTPTSTTVTTQSAIDSTPNTFTFTSQSNVARSVFVTSNTITVQGVDAGVDIPISVSGTTGEYSVSTDGGTTWGAWTTTATNVRLNYRVRLRHISSSLYNAPIVTTLSIGGVSGTFTSTTLADTVAPVISLTGGNMSLVQGTSWVEPGYSAIDNADGDISVNGVVITGSVNTNTVGTYTLTYTATDAAGNSASTTRTVTVTPFIPADNQAPVISLIGGNRSINEGDTWVEPGYTATDNVDGNITNSVVITGSVNSSVPGLYTLTYTATDAAGNVGSVTRTVTVIAAIQYPILNNAPATRTYVAERASRIELGSSVFIKQPDEILDYDIDLTEWLSRQNDDITNGSISVRSSSTELKVVGSGIIPSTKRVKVWLSSGVHDSKNQPYAIELTVTTDGLRVAQFIIRLAVVDLG